MKRLLRNSKLLLASVVLAAAGLSVAATAAPAAHAATTPTITTSVFYYGSPEQATLDIQGVNFTPSGSVKVEVFNSSFHLVWSTTVTASSLTCYPAPPPVHVVCSGGAFAANYWLVQLPPTTQTYHVIAYDYGTGRWSNWSQQSII